MSRRDCSRKPPKAVATSSRSEHSAGDWLLLGFSLAADVACVGIVAKLHKLVMIGENPQRVAKVIRWLGGETMRELPSSMPRADKLAENGKWINAMMDEGRPIISLGRDPNRVRAGEEVGKYFALEGQAIVDRGYAKVVSWGSSLGKQVWQVIRALRM